MRLGRDDSWIELKIVGYESGLPFDPEDDVYDLETEWLVLRAEVNDSVGRHAYEGLSLDVEDCVRLTRWLTAVATSRAEPSLAGATSQITFAEPDMAVQALRRVDDDVTSRWFCYDENRQSVSIPFYSGVPVTTVDVLGSPDDVEAAAQSLLMVLRELLIERAATLRAVGSGVGPDPLAQN